MDQDRITELINKSEITSIVNSYFRALDEKNFDAQHFASIFTPQAKVTRPNGASLIGPEEISASHEKSFTRFEGSQHFVAGHDISLDGSTANVRANLIAMHMWQGSKSDANKLDNFFIAGGVLHATLMQSDGQWRISQMSNAVLWRAGGFRDMMQTGTRRAKFAERCRFPASSFVVPMRRQLGRLKQGDRRCGLWCSRKPLRTAKRAGPRPSARGVRGDGPVHRGAGQGRRLRGRRRPQEQRPGQAHRLRWSRPHGHRRAVRRDAASWSPASRSGRSRTWTRRWPGRSAPPIPCRAKSEMEIRPFYEAADLAEFMTPEELSAPREGDRGKLGVA